MNFINKLIPCILISILPIQVRAEDRQCARASSQIITMESWSAYTEDNGYSDTVNLSIILRNHLDQGIRMAEGRIHFDDVLGRSITNIGVDEDANIKAGEDYEQTGRYGIFYDIDRLVKVDSNDIKTTVCIDAVVLEDGSVLRYPFHPLQPLDDHAKQQLALELQKCWNIGSLSIDALSVAVTLAFTTTSGGAPDIDSIKLITANSDNQAAITQAFEAARRAVIRCGATGFGIEEYDLALQEIELTFNPETMRIH